MLPLLEDSPAGACEDKPQQASQPSVSRNAVEAEINSLNQIAGIDWREETGSSVGIIDEMVEAMEAADRREVLLQQREGRSIPPLPPGGPPFSIWEEAGVRAGWHELSPCDPGEGAGVDASPSAMLAESGTLVEQEDDSDDESL